LLNKVNKLQFSRPGKLGIEILKTNLFLKIDHSFKEIYFLNNSKFYVKIIKDKDLYWKKSVIINTVSGRKNILKGVSFDEVFKECPVNVKMELLYNLNLFL